MRNLGQYAIQVLYDDLFQVNADERRLYVRENSSKIQKASAALRLQEGTGTLRALVNATVTFISKKQASSVINHIIQFLPVSTGGYLPPIEVEYLRILRIVLEYQPHVEHLVKSSKRNQWKDIAEFCLDGLRDSLELSRTTSPSQARSQRGIISSSSNELLGCLRALTAASNAPLAISSHVILKLVLDLLQDATAHSNISVVEGFTSGIAIVRRILTYFSLSDAVSVLEVLPLVLITSSRLFTSVTKLTALREEILLMLVMLRPHLEGMTRSNASDDLLEAVTLICNTLTEDHTVEMTSNKHRLTLDDLDLCLWDRPPPRVMPMQCGSFSLRTCSRDVEASWSQISLAAFYHVWLDGEALEDEQTTFDRAPSKQRSNHEDDHADSSRAKRRRVETHFEALIARSTGGGSVAERMRNMQVMAFAMELKAFSASRLCDVASQLLVTSSDKDVLVSTWSLTSLCTYVVFHLLLYDALLTWTTA